MKGKSVLVVVSCISILVSALLVLVVTAKDKGANHNPVSVAASEESGGKGSTPETRSEVVASGPVAPYKRYEISGSELSKKDFRLIALTVEEAAWLDRNFYPTQADLDGIGSNKLDDFRSAAALRDPRKLTIYGLELKKKGDLSAAAAVLGKAAAMGSLYAREEAALAQYELATTRFGNSLDAQSIMVAGLEAAKALGDHRATSLVHSLVPDFDYGARGAAVQAQAQEFIMQSSSSAKLLGVPSQKPDPRPNAEAWRIIDANEQVGNKVVIYQR